MGSAWATLVDVMVMLMATLVWAVGIGLLVAAFQLEGPKRLWDARCSESLARYLTAAVASRRAGAPSPQELEDLVASALAPVAPSRPQRERHLTAA